ncbi:hypothetical protein FED29_010795 [Aeromonas veronii]|nr:hypothetical protein [Aeromonas veronii]
MSLLAALAKGIGAGTVNNAQVWFAEQQRLRESTQRKEEMTEEYNRRDAQLKTQIEANQADTKARLDAQKDENKNNRDHDWAMFERRLAAETQAAAANASVRARETHAKNIMGTMDQLAKRKAELMENDKLTDDQRAVALGEIDALGYTLAADPGAQQLLGEFGGGGYANYWLSLAPKKEGGPAAPDPAPQVAPAPTTQPPKHKGIIPRMQGDRSIEKALIQSGVEALRANKNPDSTAASAYQQMYK